MFRPMFERRAAHVDRTIGSDSRIALVVDQEPGQHSRAVRLYALENLA
jgi:hypothetical protein